MCKKKKLECKTTKVLSTPILIYLIAIVCSVIFFGLSVLLSPCEHRDSGGWWSALFLNLGYGSLASIFVTVLVDIGNTRRQRQKDKLIFNRLNADLNELCAELPSEMYIAVYEVFGYNENGKHTFEQWTDTLFSDKVSDRAKQEKEIRYIIQHISLIKKAAAQLKSDFKYLPENQYIDSDYKKKLGQIIGACLRIVRTVEKSDYKGCARIITEDLKSAVVGLYSELKSDYSRFYNEEDYMG